MRYSNTILIQDYLAEEKQKALKNVNWSDMKKHFASRENDILLNNIGKIQRREAGLKGEITRLNNKISKMLKGK